ncbi:hypothetical protein DIPPA_06772 [Diplonema papillatum]|nr:hypothetical protein DIPPA_06772 [Diplonema papillatum]
MSTSPPPPKNQEQDVEEPKAIGPDDVGLVSRLLLLWLVPFCRGSGKHPIERRHVPPMPRSIAAVPLGEKFDRLWAEENAKPANKRALLKTVLRAFKFEFVSGLIHSFIAGVAMGAVRPLLLRVLIEEASGDGGVSGNATTYAWPPGSSPCSSSKQ